MEKQEEKLKCTIYVSQETFKRWEAGRILADHKSRSDFAGRAIDFYAGYLSAQNHTDFLADIFPKVMLGIVRNSETRLARLHFKTVVELAKLAHTVASLADIDDETLRTLHIRCVDEVKRINGVIKFEDAVHYQHGE